MFKNVTATGKAPALQHDQMIDAILDGERAAADLQGLCLLDRAAEIYSHGGDVATLEGILNPDAAADDHSVITALEALSDETDAAHTHETSKVSRKERIKKILLVYGGAAAAIALCGYLMHRNAKAIDAAHEARLDAMRDSMKGLKFKITPPGVSERTKEITDRLTQKITPVELLPTHTPPKAPSTALATVPGQGVKDHLRPGDVGVGRVIASRSDRSSAAVAELTALSEKARALNELFRVNVNAVTDPRTRKTLPAEWAAYKEFAQHKTKLSPRPISDRRVSGIIEDRLNLIKGSLVDPGDAQFSSRAEDMIDHLTPKEQSVYLGMMQKIALEHKRISDAALAVIKSLH